MENEYAMRVSALRENMKIAGVSAVIVPQTDPHQSEYLADHWQVRRWFSGFTGSAGALVVTLTEAFVWADSRYWLQAAEQLSGTGIGVMEEGKPEVPAIADWLVSTLKRGDVVATDGMLLSVQGARELRARLVEGGIELRTDFDPSAGLWNDRPALPADKAFVHEKSYAGESADSKMARVLDGVTRQGADAVFVSDLAEIAWMLNLRSSDVKCNPVLTSFLYVSNSGAVLFVDEEKIDSAVAAHLAEANVTLAPYDSIGDFLSAIPADVKVLVNAGQVADALAMKLGDRAREGASPVAMLKAVKNDVQIEGVRHAMVRDGVALVHSFMEIERKVAAGERLTEIDVADILLQNRKAQPLFFDLSFDTIAGYGAHGAIVHYSATEKSNVAISGDNLLLVDSGANYFDGTTDITRTVALGVPTESQRHDFTLVMKGHIAVAQAIFPVGTRGAQLDVLARINLWREGLSYLHGTGHGVGHFLTVHEGPQSIRLNDTLAPLTPGMITSNEPGLYREGEYGIRCENLVLTKKAFTTDFGEFLRFETLTLFPFDLNLFDTDLMTDSEIDWVNEYHAMVCERLLPALDAESQDWLLKKTRPLHRTVF